MSSSSNGPASSRVVRPEGGGPAPAAVWRRVSVPGERARVHEDPVALAREAGYADGYSAAQLQFEGVVESERSRVRAAIVDAAAAVGQRRSEAMATVTAEVVGLAIELAEALVGRALSDAGDVDPELIASTLALAPSGEDLLVHLHPGSAADADELGLIVPGVNLRVVADPAVEPGGCVIEAGACRIDRQVGPALARARAVLGNAPVLEPTP